MLLRFLCLICVVCLGWFDFCLFRFCLLFCYDLVIGVVFDVVCSFDWIVFK